MTGSFLTTEFIDKLPVYLFRVALSNGREEKVFVAGLPTAVFVPVVSKFSINLVLSHFLSTDRTRPTLRCMLAHD